MKNISYQYRKWHLTVECSPHEILQFYGGLVEAGDAPHVTVRRRVSKKNDVSHSFSLYVISNGNWNSALRNVVFFVILIESCDKIAGFMIFLPSPPVNEIILFLPCFPMKILVIYVDIMLTYLKN